MQVLSRQRSSRPGSYSSNRGGNEAVEAGETGGRLTYRLDFPAPNCWRSALRDRLHIKWFLFCCALVFNCGCEGSAELEVSPSELNFGVDGTCQEFFVRNVGDEGYFTSEVDLEYQVKTFDPWITISTEYVVCSVGEQQSCGVCINRDRMSPGVNAGAVFISSNGGDAVVGVKAEN